MGEKRRPTIAIMAGNTSSEYFAELIAGFRTCAKEEDVNLMFLMGPHIPRHCKDILNGSFSWDYDYQFHTVYDYVHFLNPDALIVAYGSLSHFKYVPDVDEFVARFKGIPTIVMGDRVEDPEVPYLIGGNYRGMRECIEHLVIDHGYRKIGFLAGPQRNYDSNRRLKAYKDVLTENGIEITDSMIVHGNYTEAVEAEVEALLDNNPGIQAIACANDNMAKAAYRVCAARDLVVGHDIAITGFDDGDIAKRLEPPLSSVSHSSFVFSYRVLQAAIELCNGNKPKSEELRASFRKRASCGCKFSLQESRGVKSLEELKEYINEKVAFITDELFSSVPYDTDKENYGRTLHKFFDEVMAQIFEGRDTEHADEHIFRLLKKMCQHPFISKRILLEYVDSIFFEFMEYTEDEQEQLTISSITKSCRQYIHSQEVTGLQHSIRDSERKMWFLPSFITDLINARLDMREQMAYLMGRLKGMGIKSAYLCFYMDAVTHHPGERFCGPDNLYLTAYYNEFEQVCFRPSEMIHVAKDGNGLEAVLPKDKARFYTSYVLFSAEEQYGLIVCEVEQVDFAFMLTCSMQLGSLRRIINLNIRERMMQKELEEKNRILNELSAYDELSQLLNRRGFMEKALKFVKDKNGQRACLLFADIDHLKEINDCFGHAAGDFAITTASEYLRQCMPEEAITARIGGDEYVSLFICESEHPEEEIRQCMKDYAKEFNATCEQPFYVEMSAGIYEFVCDASTDLGELFKKSDAVLYEQKRLRRTSIKKIV